MIRRSEVCKKKSKVKNGAKKAPNGHPLDCSAVKRLSRSEAAGQSLNLWLCPLTGVKEFAKGTVGHSCDLVHVLSLLFRALVVAL